MTYTWKRKCKQFQQMHKTRHLIPSLDRKTIMNLHHVQLDDNRHLTMSVSLKFEMLPMEDILSSVEIVTAPCWMKLSRWFSKGMKRSVGLDVIKWGCRTRPSIHCKMVPTFWSYQQTRAIPVLWAADCCSSARSSLQYNC